MSNSSPRDPFYVSIFVVFGIALIIPLLFGASSFRNYYEAWAVSSALFGALVFFLGLFVSLPRSSRRMGMGMLLSSAVLLLVSFSLCSSGVVRLGL